MAFTYAPWAESEERTISYFLKEAVRPLWGDTENTVSDGME